MLEIQGSCNVAKVFAACVEPSAEGQIRAMCDLPWLEDSKIRIMPDVHAGKGCTIGTTMTLHGRVSPNMVGVDIGCGMETIRLEKRRMELAKLDRLIRENIPAGMRVRTQRHRWADEANLDALRCRDHVRMDYALQSIGTLGGGNHFIEVDRDEDGALYLVIHTGSRHLGVEVAQYYQSAGWRALASSELPHDLAYVENALFDDYIHDMRIVQQFAQLNRRAIADTIMKGMKLDAADRFETIHNYIDTEHMILRKGAISARKDERVLIPINMRDGSLLCTGLGNEDWNCSAPHGAGRLYSRSEAKNRFTVSDFKKQMKDVFTTSVSKETLDECPMAYKSMESIVECIVPTVRIDRVIRPMYNFKAGEE